MDQDIASLMAIGLTLILIGVGIDFFRGRKPSQTERKHNEE